MIEPKGTTSPSPRGQGGHGLRPVHGAVVAVSVVVAVVVAFAVLSSIVGFVAVIVKIAVIAVIVGFVVRLVTRHARG